jgi:hypothetical protein
MLEKRRKGSAQARAGTIGSDHQIVGSRFSGIRKAQDPARSIDSDHFAGCIDYHPALVPVSQAFDQVPALDAESIAAGSVVFVFDTRQCASCAVSRTEAIDPRGVRERVAADIERSEQGQRGRLQEHTRARTDVGSTSLEVVDAMPHRAQVDGRRDTGDAQVMLKAVERVVARHPELTGGAGVYKATSAHGPFIHIDVRGTRARW